VIFSDHRIRCAADDMKISLPLEAYGAACEVQIASSLHGDIQLDPVFVPSLVADSVPD